MNRKDLLHEQVYDRVRQDEFIMRQAKALGVSRRRVLQLLTAAGAAVGTTLTPTALRRQHQVANAQTTSNDIVKSTSPEFFYQTGSNLEMRWETMYNRGYLVPNELFFVRNNNPTPRLDPAAWRVKIEGSGVSRPQSFSYDDLLSMPSVSVIRAIECAGNGRSFYETAYGRQASGTQWKLGGIGVAEWTGVPLREVIERAGVKSTAQDVLAESLDQKKVARPIPIEKAMAEDTLLVYAMNGAILPADHGFPIRLLTPGWVGIANVKWVGRIEVSESPIYTVWNTEKYILIGEDYEPEPGSPALGQIVTTQNVKSAFELQWDAELSAGKHLLRGRSWSGQGKNTRVEVSFDQGKTWQLARLREPNYSQAWVRWDIDWQARPGSYRLQARATDDQGQTQPDQVPFNQKGYLYWGVVSHPISVS